jgi:hypothetical protein
MDKYEELRLQKTSGINYDLETEDIIRQLKQWDETYGIDISDVAFDSVFVQFKTLPDDLNLLAEEIYEFCPDTIDQHFGCVADMIGAAEEMEQEIPEDVRQLTDGVDFEDEDYGLELLKRSLKRDKAVALWWD